MIFRPLTLALAIAAATMIFTTADAAAKVTRVGPQTFHNQIQIPNAMGRNSTFNNDDGFTAPDRRSQRLKERLRRDLNNRSNSPNNDEARTQSDVVKKPERQGRRERQRNTSRNKRPQPTQQRSAQPSVNQGVNN